MIHIESTIQISSTRGGVFELLTDVDSYSKWQKGVVTSKHVSEGPMRVGFVFEETARIAFWTLKTVCTVNEYIPNQRFGFAATSNGPISYQGRFELQPVADGTRLTFNGSARLKGLWRLLEPLFGADLRKEAREELQSRRFSSPEKRCHGNRSENQKLRSHTIASSYYIVMGRCLFVTQISASDRSNGSTTTLKWCTNSRLDEAGSGGKRVLD